MIAKLSEKLAALTGIRPKLASTIVVLVAIVLALVVAGAVVWLLGPRLPRVVWVVVGAVVAVMVLLWLAFRSIPRYLEHRFMQKHSGDLTPGDASDAQAPRERMNIRLEEARTIWEKSQQLSSVREAQYWMPFYLLLGNQQAGQTSLLQAAAHTSPFAPPQRTRGADPEWLVWWFHKDAVVIETSPEFPCDQGDRVTRGIWYHALQILRTSRPKLPLNGFIVLVSVEVLKGEAAAIRDYGQRIRRLLDEALAQLQLVAPVYVIVTRLEQLSGAEDFFKVIPKETFSQVFGHVFADTKAGQEAWQQNRTVFAEIESRLHAIRLGALAREFDVAAKGRIFEFVSDFATIGGGLDVFTKTLFEDNVLQRRVPWRGLFFSSGLPGRAFVADLFLRFLPGDQPQAVRSNQKRLMGWVGVFFLVGCAALLSAFLIGQFDRAYDEDLSVAAHASDACGKLITGTVDSKALDACRKDIVELDAKSAGRSWTFGLNSADRTTKAFRAAYAVAYRKHVLDVVDKAVDETGAQKKTAFLPFAILTQRIDLIRACRAKPDGCAEIEKSHFSIASTVAGSPATAETASTDADLLFAYLRWLDSAGLERDEQQAIAKLKNLLGQGMPAYPDLVAWGEVSSIPFTVNELWRPGFKPVTPVAPAAKPATQVDPFDALLGKSESHLPEAAVATASAEVPVALAGYFRRSIAASVVQPLVRVVAELDPARAEGAKALGKAYASGYYAGWSGLLSQFANGMHVWTGAQAELTQQLLTEDTPFTRLFALFRNDVVAWKQELGPVPAWVKALDGTLGKEGKEAAVAAADLLRASVQDVGGRGSFDMARALFAPTPQADAAAPAKAALKALSSIERPGAEEQKSMGAGDFAAWSAVQGPLRTAFYLTGYRAVEFLDATWQKDIAVGMANRAPKEQIEYLMGPNGKLKWFAETYLKPFYGQDGLPVSRLGVALPLNTDFQAYLRQASGDQEKLAGGAINAGSVQVSTSSLGAVAEGPTGTVFELICQTQKFTASSKGTSLAETRVDVFWSPKGCLNVVISIAAGGSPDAPAEGGAGAPASGAGVKLVKIYPGAEGFIAFVKDFKSGSKAFRLSDFAASYPPAQWRQTVEDAARLGLGGARVNIRVDPSPDLEVFMNGPRKPPTTLLPARLG